MSDLHLASSDAADRGHAPFDEESFAALVEWLVRAENTSRLLLLGDIFDLPPPDRSVSDAFLCEADEELEAIVRRYPLFIAALRRAISAGIRLDFVAGNHDVALQFAPLQARVESVLNADPTQLGFHPWFLHEQGLFYAEHGHQLHDLMSYAGPAEIYTSVVWHGRPLGAILEARRWSDARSGSDRRASPARVANLLAEATFVAFGSLSGRHRGFRQRYEAVSLPRLAAAQGLLPETVIAISRAERASLRRATLRLARKAAAHARGRIVEVLGAADRASWSRDDYLIDGWRRVADALRSSEPGPPYYLFGHTHLARRLPRPDEAP